MEYMYDLDDRIRDLENELENHKSILRKLAEAIKSGHDEICKFNNALEDIRYKPFSILHGMHCVCENKHIHHKRCTPILERQFENKFCDCGFKEVKDIFGEL